MQVERLSYGKLTHCYRLSNGVIELIVPAEVGLRIIHCGFVGERNEFFQTDPLEVPADRDAWQLYGGHRLWLAPEMEGRTTIPDNQPITVEERGDVVRLIQPVEAVTNVVKEIDIRFEADSASVEVIHRVHNRNIWDVQLALWAISVMRPGGTAIIPLPPRGTHPKDLLPTATLTLWPYTDLSDPRFRFGRKYVYVAQDRNATTPQKIGAAVSSGWAAYVNEHHVFVKEFVPVQGAVYPDLHSSVEVFTSPELIELETLSPLLNIAPSGSAEYHERWTLAKDVTDLTNDDDIDRYVLPLVMHGTK